MAPPVDLVLDLHGDPTTAELVVYLGGNYFFVLPELVDAFTARHPELSGKVFYETLPPEIVIEQLRRGGRITMGNMSITAPADVLHAGLSRLEELRAEGIVSAPIVPLGSTGLAILVRTRNPARVRSLTDLGREGLRLANPNPETEGIAQQIQRALTRAGGEELRERVYSEKARIGDARLTTIHHRETPLWILEGQVDAGVVWKTEALFHEQEGHGVEHVPVAEEHDQRSTIAAAVVSSPAHPQAARKWLDFLRTKDAREIFRRFGFGEPQTESGETE